MALTESASYHFRIELLPMARRLDMTFLTGLVKPGRLELGIHPTTGSEPTTEADARVVIRGRKGPRP
ncbi:hypothetical protein [Catellatospora tritici]|uniref:hypothetical protein n=1 Tax=Catellatospora tritici TaxID=2851566 RepID=UPI001C2CE2F9|nr:hypothetical protein [Catellatospora tritici]MBV1848948.1 hypothetical protein [Catellatospora tritici]